MPRVLVVDDEPGLRQSLGLLLADAGYAVTAEGDGRRGLERALAEPFDLILCDVRMPGLDGLAFLRGYRERGGEGLVIMMKSLRLTLLAQSKDVYKCPRCRNDYSTKPKFCSSCGLAAT